MPTPAYPLRMYREFKTQSRTTIFTLLKVCLKATSAITGLQTELEPKR